MLLSKDYKKRYEGIFRELLEKEQNGRFDEAALPSYTHSNKLMSFLFWKRVETALALAGDLKKRSVLDFGCGGGVTFRHLADYECGITGCDNQFHEIAENICRRLDINALIVEDLFELDNKYDIIFALDVLEHIEELEKYLQKIKTLMRPDGRLIVSGPTENFLYRIGRKLAGFSGHYHLRNIYTIENKLEKTGLRRIRVKLLYFPTTLFRVSCWQYAR